MPELIINAREASISENMSVLRILPFRSRRMVGPFIFMDHAGPVQVDPREARNMDVLPHPHIGLSTVTYLFSGKVTHRDSLGVQQDILPGEVNWMTAGKGISHSERFEDPAALSGGLEMLQTWVALPEEMEEHDPAFSNFSAGQLQVFNENGIYYRLIAGNFENMRSPVPTLSPLIYMHVELLPGATMRVPDNYTERGVYIVRGSLDIGAVRYTRSQLIVLGKGEEPLLRAAEACVLMLLGGEPLGPRHIWWNFVSSRKERIEQAKADWQAGRIILPPGDDQSFVPLPPDRRAGDPSPGILS